jgi:NAD(P)-dependent dehydrogenase (short-subunit alcohol dehydrogenase family)
MADKNKIALITGATSGFGVVIARHLVKQGYSLIVFGRSKDKLDSLVLELKEVDVNCTVDSILCNLSSLKSIQHACESIQTTYSQIDLLVLNAGVWNFKFVETEDHIEETLQVNLLAPVLIFQRLNQLLPANGKTKVIFTSSGLHQGAVDFSDIEFRNSFSGFKAYRQSKLGVILMMRLFAKKEAYPGISFYAVHPGMVNTNLGRSAGWFSRMIFKLLGKSKEKGALTHLYLIDEPTSKLTSGEYYANSQITKASSESYNLENADKLLNTINVYFDKHIKSESKS